MFEPLPKRQSLLKASYTSTGLHVIVLTALFLSLKSRPVHVFTLPGSTLGSRIELAYLPGRAAASTSQPKERKLRPHNVRQAIPEPAKASAPATPTAIHPPPTPHLTVTESAPGTQGPPSENPDSTTGSDSYGDGAIQIALTTFSPSPKPDLSALPHGLQGDVVVDVTIDPTGKVADLAVLHTIGYGIESSVIGTLKTWQFRPATKDGAPIASVQELHFHFGPV